MSYKGVFEKFDSFFKVGINVIFEQARFNRWKRNQDKYLFDQEKLAS